MQGPKINLLDIATANKISAGEVIDRPASVIKELIENSIDAQGTNINIEIKDGGISEIIIRDNGIGIPPDEIGLAFKRHATSKIRKVDDLYSIRTFGFRGEALPSIAAISKVSVLTKVRGSKVGTRYIIEGGKEILREEAACSEGTQITVSDIFYNVPPRKKHLKTPAKEAAYIAQVVTSMALGNPQIQIKYYHNNKLVAHSAGTGKLSDSIITLMGVDFFKSLLAVNYENANGLKVEGYISKPQFNRASRNNQYIFVNNRWIYSQLINKAITNAYSTLIPANRHPIVILNLTIPFDTVDVNVHPTKREIRFDNEYLVEKFILEALNETINTKESVAAAKKSIKIKPAKTEQITFKWPSAKLHLIKENNFHNDLNVEYSYNKKMEYQPENVVEEIVLNDDNTDIINEKEIDNEEKQTEKFPNLEPLAQIDASYIIAVEQGTKGFYVVDQHAAHERITYDKIKKEYYSNKKCRSQILLEPQLIDLSPAEKECIIENSLLLKETGFIIEYFGDNTFLIRGIPSDVNMSESINLFKDLLDDQNEKKQKFNVDRILKTIACKSSVTAKKNLTISEMSKLLTGLAATELPYTCPHGRPTVVYISEKELINRFNR